VSLGVDAATFDLVGNDASFTLAGETEINTDVGSFALTGNEAVLSRSRNRRRNILIF